MEYLSSSDQAAAAAANEQHKILCCQCGVPIAPNPSNTCVACLRARTDIAQAVPRQSTLNFCRFCERYLNPPSQWVACALESRELMALCLKKLKQGLQTVRLVDASFIWTEPHSKRIKVKLVVQGEVEEGAVLQQTVPVEFVVAGQMCDDCRKVEAKDTWNASVQVRQKSGQRKTLFYLEQLLIKYQATKDCSSIKLMHEGLDFYFSSESGAKKLVEFLQGMIPCRTQHSKRLVSHDAKSNLYNYKYTSSVEVVPICKDNVVCLPKKLAHSLGGIGQVCVATKISNAVHLIDPTTCQVADISSSTYFKSPFNSLCIPKQLVEYTVMDIDIIQEKDRNKFSGQGTLSKKHVLADAWVVRSSELGGDEDSTHVRTHLGHLLQPGDTVMGYDLKNSNVNDRHLEEVKTDKLPDVVLVKKCYGDKARRNRRRKWRLKRLAKEQAEGSAAGDEYMEFMEDLEESADMRQFVNVYKRQDRLDAASSVAADEGAPQISLAEMMDEMDLGAEVEEEGDKPKVEFE